MGVSAPQQHVQVVQKRSGSCHTTPRVRQQQRETLGQQLWGKASQSTNPGPTNENLNTALLIYHFSPSTSCRSLSDGAGGGFPCEVLKQGCRAEQEPGANTSALDHNLPCDVSAAHQNIAIAITTRTQARCCLTNRLRSRVVTSFALYMKTVDSIWRTLTPHFSG